MGKQQTEKRKRKRERNQKGNETPLFSFMGNMTMGAFLLPSPVNHTKGEKERLKEKEREGRPTGDGKGASGTVRCAWPSHNCGPSRQRERSTLRVSGRLESGNCYKPRESRIWRDRASWVRFCYPRFSIHYFNLPKCHSSRDPRCR